MNTINNNDILDYVITNIDNYKSVYKEFLSIEYNKIFEQGKGAFGTNIKFYCKDKIKDVIIYDLTTKFGISTEDALIFLEDYLDRIIIV